MDHGGRKNACGAERDGCIVKGFPFDLAWYDPQTKPRYTVVVEDKKGLFEADAQSEADAEAIAGNAILGQQVGQQILTFPIRVGDYLGEESNSSEQRTDHMYCWFVKKEANQSSLRGWEIVHQTGPDEITFHIVPGLGITSFIYNHHGTVAYTNARLIGFHQPQRP